MACLKEFLRLDGNKWDAWSSPAHRLASEAVKRAIQICADADTLAFLQHQSADRSVMSAHTGFAMLQRLAEWCAARTQTQVEATAPPDPTADRDQAGSEQVESPSESGTPTALGAKQSKRIVETTDAESEPTDRQQLILETMLAEEITSRRRRQTRAAIVRLINRNHKTTSYGRDFATLVKRGFLQSEQGPDGGVWMTPEGKAVVERSRSSN